jgi:acyl-coenzyme A thioesterase PaaI-like protein
MQNLSTEFGHSRCLMCGMLNPGSLRLSFQDSGGGVVVAGFQANPMLQGYDNILHGGVIASLLDTAMTHCLFHHKIRAVTGDLHVNFIKPIGCRERLKIRGWIESSFPPLYRLRAEILVSDVVVAKADAKFIQ